MHRFLLLLPLLPAIAAAGPIADTCRTMHTTSATASSCYLNDWDATSGSLTANLPTCTEALAGLSYLIQKDDASANAVTIDPAGAATIDGASTVVLAVQYARLAVACKGSSGNWTRLNPFTSADAGQITTGTLGTARLGSGTADTTTFLRGDQTWQTVTGGLGTVTSVAQTVPTEFSIAGSPIIAAGTLAITKATQNANKVWAGPVSGGDAQPAFRVLVSDDVPALAQSKITNLTTDLAAKAATATTLTAGAGLSGGGDLSANRTFATDSTEAAFLAPGALTCGAGTSGKAKVHTTPLQYCDDAATPALQYAAYGDSAGKALTAAAADTATSATSATSATTATTAATATALATPRNINGVAFDGTANITVTAAGSTLTGSTIAAGMLGTAGNTAAAGNDARLSDARAPTAHATTHESGGADEVLLDASQVDTGTLTQARGGTGAGALTCTPGDVLTSDGSVYSCVTPAGGSGLTQAQTLARVSVGF